MRALHPKQTELLEILKSNISDPLTMEELADRLNVSGKSVVFHHIKQLEKRAFKAQPRQPARLYYFKRPGA